MVNNKIAEMDNEILVQDVIAMGETAEDTTKDDRKGVPKLSFEKSWWNDRSVMKYMLFAWFL